MHNINWNQQKGIYSFVTARERAWHGLGQLVENAMTSAEAIREAGLDYLVEKEQAVAHIQGEVKPIPGRFATYRTDTGQILGEVGKNYTVIQNESAFDFFDQIVGAKEAIFETAGALGDGQKIFITAKLPSHIRVGKDDLIEMYIFLFNTHDGSKPAMAAFTPIRIVCNNTLNSALKSCVNQVSFRHTSNVEDRLKQGAELMGLVNQYQKDIEEAFNFMSKVRVDDALLKNIIVTSMANKAQLERLATDDEMSAQFCELVNRVYDYTISAPSQQLDTTKGTLFGVYNGITGYFNNVKDYKSQEAKFQEINLGKDAMIAQRALDLCLSIN